MRLSYTFEATEEMHRRVSTEIRHTIPSIDLNDISKKRQFAPEYSQNAYNSMLRDEYAIGNYLNAESETWLCISGEDRKSMVLLLEELNEEEEWNDETLMLAVSIADRYLYNLSREKVMAPCLVTLSVTCLMLAAKIE